MAYWKYAGITRDAFDSLRPENDPDFLKLTFDTQRHLHDIAVDIVEHGCPTTPFECAVHAIAEKRRNTKQSLEDRAPTVEDSPVAEVFEELPEVLDEAPTELKKRTRKSK